MFYLDNIARNYLSDNIIRPKTRADVRIQCNLFGCEEVEVLMLHDYKNIIIIKEIEQQLSKIELMTEKEKDKIREELEQGTYSVRHDDPNYIFEYSLRKIGYYNRDGIYGHEGKHYYKFAGSDWYKPTTNNLDEVKSKLSDVEKYNIEFIKAYEAKMQSGL